jgi:flagellar biogenesis protein FliO
MRPMDTALGLFELVVYVAGILAFSMAITWVVVRVSPSESAKEQKAKEASEA